MRSSLARTAPRSAPAPARATPRAAPAPAARLQSRLGNAGAAAALAARGAGPRVEVGAPGDSLERQADAAAEAVLAGRPPPPLGAAPGLTLVQRKCKACEGDALLQRKETGAGDGLKSGFEAAAQAVSRGGRPLSRTERAYFEPRFGRDFSHVRLHDGPAAAAAAKGIGASAYMLGPNIGFAAGAYSPGAPAGDRLLAHELAHTVQQDRGAGPAVIRRQPLGGFAPQGAGDGFPSMAPPSGWTFQARGGDSEPDPNALYFPYARAVRDTGCPSGACHEPNRPGRFPTAKTPSRTLVTKPGLIAWSRNYILESARKNRGWVIAQVLRRQDALFPSMLRRFFDESLKMVLSSHAFVGPEKARQDWAVVLRLERDSLLESAGEEFQAWAEGQLVAEIDTILHTGRVPPDAEFVADAADVKMLETDPPTDASETVFRSGAEWFGRRVKAVNSFGSLWFEVIGHEGFYFSMRKPDWRDMVWSNVANAMEGMARVGRFIRGFAEALASPVTMALDTAAKVIDIVSIGGKALGAWEGATCLSSTCQQYTACLESGKDEDSCKSDLVVAAVKEASVIAPLVEQGHACFVNGDEEACGGVAALALGLAHEKLAGKRAPLSLQEIEAAAIRERIGRRLPGDPVFGGRRKGAAVAEAPAAAEAPTAQAVEKAKGGAAEKAARRDYASGRSNLEGFARRVGETAKRLKAEIKSLWDQVRDRNKVTEPDIMLDRFDAQMRTPENGGHTYRRERAGGGQFWCRWSTEACGLNPGSDFNAAVTDTVKGKKGEPAEHTGPTQAGDPAKGGKKGEADPTRAQEAAARKAAKEQRAEARKAETDHTKRLLEENREAILDTQIERQEVQKSDRSGPEKKAELQEIDQHARKLDEQRGRLQAQVGELALDPAEKLRAYSYSAESGRTVANRALGFDEYSKMGPEGAKGAKKIKEPSIDHLNSIDEMVEWGILDLAEADQRRIVSLPENLFMMEKSLNSSKGAHRNLRKWKEGVRYYGPYAIDAMQAAKATAAKTIKAEIAKTPKASGAKGKILEPTH